MCRARDDQRRARVLEHRREPRRRISGIERHVRGSRLRHRQHGDDQVDAAFEAHADERSPPGAVRAKHVRQAIRGVIELRVPDASARSDQRDRLR